MGEKRTVRTQGAPTGVQDGDSEQQQQQRIPLSGRTGALVMRSVSIFLASGRKASSISNSRRQSAASQSVRRRRRMPAVGGETGALKSAAHYAKIVEALKKKTKFTKQELEVLCKLYNRLTTNPDFRSGSSIATNGATIEGIDRTLFRELLHNTFDLLTEDLIIERMFTCWDKHSEGAIRIEAWIMGLDVFLRGSTREKMEFCFRVYDLNNDGYISKDEIFQLFKNSLMKHPGEEDPEEGVRDLSEMAFKKFDLDHDGKVSFGDYEATVRDEPLLLEAFGQVLPSPESAAAFLLTLKPNG